MAKLKNPLKNVSLILLSVFLFIFIINFVICNVYYNPNKDAGLTETMFSGTTQLLFPSTTSVWMNSNNSSNPFSFSHYSQRFYFYKFSETSDGIFKYSFGKIRITDYNEKLNLGDIPIMQEIFMNDPVKTPQSYWDEIKPNEPYEIWFKFNSPKTTNIVFEEYDFFLKNGSTLNGGLHGVKWIPVKTSDKSNDICLGMSGNLSAYFFDPWYRGSIDRSNIDAYDCEGSFQQILTLLSDHPKETQMFLQSGLYKGAENLDIKGRLNYIDENGIFCLGMVVYARGDKLLSLKNDDTIRIVKFIENK